MSEVVATAAAAAAAAASSSSSSATSDLTLPLARVKKLVKMDPDVKQITQNAAKVLTKATELFVAYLVRKAHERTVQEKRKIIQYQDCAMAVQQYDTLEFLFDVVPHKVHMKQKDASAAAPAKRAKKSEAGAAAE
jgi:DNA polymerase epsilon subunit 4